MNSPAGTENLLKQVTGPVRFNALPVPGRHFNACRLVRNSLFYYDEKAGTWMPLPTQVNTTTNQISGSSDHLMVFDFDIQNWEGATLPTVKGFQVALYTDAATYAYPFQLPPGPGGFQPNLQLSYNSQVVDSATNKTQASWVGMGWSLETGYIERDMHNGLGVGPCAKRPISLTNR